MTTHAAPRKPNQPSLPNQPFFSWLRTHTTLFIGQIIGLLSVLSVPIALFYYSIHSIPENFEWQKLEKVGLYVIYAHLLFLVVFIAVLVRRLDKNRVGGYRAKLVHEKLNGEKASPKELKKLEAYSTKQVARFKRRFLGFWCAMLCLYLIFAIEPMFSVPAEDCLQVLTLKEMFRTEFFPILSFVLNNLSLILIFWCFSVLYLPLDATPGKPTDPTPPGGMRPRFSQLVRRLVQKFSRSNLDERELRQRTLVLSFGVIVAALTITFPLIMFTKIGVPTNWSEYPAVFDALSGTLNAIVLALLVARLDSKLIGLPSWLICILYCYAGVQPMFVVFELHPVVYAGVKTAVIWVVFIFKIYFFLIILFSLQTGRLFNYFFCSQVLNDHIKMLKAPLPPANTPISTPAKQATAGDQDLRAIWFKRLGVVAILFFAGSLLFYVSLSEPQKLWVDELGLSELIVKLHMGLLFVILLFVYRASRKEKKSGFQPSDQSSFKKPAELRFRLYGPKSEEARKEKFDELSDRTKDQFRTFTRYFRLFWVAMFFLYTAMWLSGTGESPEHYQSKPCPVKVEQTTPTLEGPPILTAKVAFFSPSEPAQNHTVPVADHGSATPKKSEPSSTSQVVEKYLSIHEMAKNVKYSFVFFVVNNFTVLIVFLCFTVLYIPADDEKFEEKRQLLRNYSILICVLLTVLVPLLLIVIKSNAFTPSETEKIPTILGAVGGTLNAVAFALLIARLDSRIIGLRLLLVAVLYAYAALQPLFVTFNQPSNVLKFIATSAMIAAFIFKICLVLMVGHVRRSGGLIDYLWFFPIVSKSVNSIFSNQFEIKAYSPKPGFFTYSISHNSVETYKAVEMYTTRADCDKAIKTLIKAMKKRESYGTQPKELQGTYWIEVRSDEKLLCESRGFRSHSETDALINESIEEVPYCKYDRG